MPLEAWLAGLCAAVDTAETTTPLKNHCVGFCTPAWGHVMFSLCF
jgi:hypothetical protein